MRSLKSSSVRRQIQLDQYASVNRNSPTLSEAVLWEALRGRKLGVQFRRQVPLAGRFIVDFLAPPVRLIVEVDGGCHRGHRLRDERRDETLRALGYRVLRLDAELVVSNLVAALANVRAALG